MVGSLHIRFNKDVNVFTLVNIEFLLFLELRVGTTISASFGGLGTGFSLLDSVPYENTRYDLSSLPQGCFHFGGKRKLGCLGEPRWKTHTFTLILISSG